MQIHNARQIFESKTQEHDVWIGGGMFSLKTAEGNFSSEANVLVVRTTDESDLASHWAIFEGNRVLISEKLYHMLSEIFCARQREIKLTDAVFMSVEGFELDLTVG
ncbi:hypothetical protein MD588_00895 [Photobacterium sp. SDRW27]|uniref:hypothetical protein n=1 Tax=Photobacterium obscurum TaxID=2829490 RepID=UPI002244EDBA|nr:hypothetical protein [Photobacterium obscurum]MCW8327357.1 hypothetical protein [Photobacterium obscurum]